MIRWLWLSFFIFVMASSSWAIESTRFKLDTIKTPSYLSQNITASFNRFSMIDDQEQLFRVDIPSNNIHPTRTYQSFFSQFMVSSLYGGLPYVVTFSLFPTTVSLGASTLIDLEVSEELSSWIIRIDGILQLNSAYNNRHLLVEYTPILEGMRSHEMNLSIADMGWNIGLSTINFVLRVGGVDEIVQTLRTEDIMTQVRPGKTDYPALVFDLMAPDYEYLLDGVSINIDSLESLSMFDAIYLINPSTNEVIVSSSVVSLNEPFFMPLSSMTMVTSQNMRLELRLDVKSSAPVGATFDVQLNAILCHQVGSVGNYIHILGALDGGIVKVVDLVSLLQIDDFTSVTSSITVNFSVETLGPIPTQFRYQLFDVTSMNIFSLVSLPFSSLPTSGIVYVLSQNVISPFSLIHAHDYCLAAQILNPLVGDWTSSNIFRVDITPPTVSNKLKIQTMTVGSSNMTGAKLNIDTRQWLDPESGLKRYEIFRKKGVETEWTVIVSGNVSSENVTSVNIEEENEFQYYYASRLQNRAGLWSELSDARDLDLRLGGQLIAALYNSPNPFDARKQSTTIYYTLGSDSDVDIVLYDMFGYLIKKWHFLSGTTGGQKMFNTFVWDGTNQLGDKVSKGAYILFMKATDTNGVSMQKKYSIGVIR